MSYATAALATFTNMLGTLDHLVATASKQENSAALLNGRLADDMFALENQFRVATKQIDQALIHLCGMEIAFAEEPLTSFAEVGVLLQSTRDRVAQAASKPWPEAEAGIEFTLPNGMQFAMKAHEYVRDWIMPNFYFHTSMAYALLRHQGVEIGKADFIPHMFAYMKRD